MNHYMNLSKNYNLYSRIAVKSALQKLDRNRELMTYQEYINIKKYLENNNTFKIGKQLLNDLIESKK